MANLDRLMGLGGATAACEFTAGGDLVTYKGDLPEDIARLIAKMCAANSLMGATEADSFTRISGMNCMPFHGWAVSAGEFSICVMGNIGVFVETVKADFNNIYEVLFQEAHITLKAA